MKVESIETVKKKTVWECEYCFQKFSAENEMKWHQHTCDEGAADEPFW